MILAYPTQFDDNAILQMWDDHLGTVDVSWKIFIAKLRNMLQTRYRNCDRDMYAVHWRDGDCVYPVLIGDSIHSIDISNIRIDAQNKEEAILKWFEYEESLSAEYAFDFDDFCTNRTVDIHW